MSTDLFDEASDLGYEVGSLGFFCLEIRVTGWAPQKGACSELHGTLEVVQVEIFLPCHWIPPGKLVGKS